MSPEPEDRTPGSGPGGGEIDEVFVYLCVRNAAAAIRFYSQVFGAEETFRLEKPEGRVGHAELRFGPATVMLCDEHPEYGILGPDTIGGTGARVHLHVRNVDRMAERAAGAGAEILMEPTDFGHGERQCRLRDPFGHEWLLGHPLEEVPQEEMIRRYAEEVGGEG